MKILLITSEHLTGLNYHRQLVPFNTLGFEIDVCPKWTSDITDDDLKKYNCISFLRTIDIKGQSKEIAERIHKLGIKIHFDIDDYWKLPSSHPQYKAYKEQKISEQTIEALEAANFITTTTNHLASRIKDYNKNVYVLPNAINPELEQWKSESEKAEKLRFGYIAGVHHVRDVEILYENLSKFWDSRDVSGKFTLSPAGFNLNKGENGKVYMNQYYNYVEKVFTHNYKYIKNADYKAYLKDNNPTNNSQFINESYFRLWGTDTFNYAKLYDHIDVSLVPLEQNMFSACKSELKMIEAGFKKKAVIVSNVKPYDNIITDGNCLSILPSRNHIEWFTSMRKLVLNPNMVSDLGEALYSSVKEKYHINTVNQVRKQIFEANVK